MCKFPSLSGAKRLSMLEPPSGPVSAVLDTDAFNEIDDQYALAYMLLAKERIRCKAVYAAPFRHVDSKEGPAEGMEKSYDEILRILKFLDHSPEGFAFRGADDYIASRKEPVASEASRHLIHLAMTCTEGPLYVLAIGASTNVASAILLEPRIIEHIVVVWLGGQPLSFPSTEEFNMMQDIPAAQVLFDSGVPLVHVPCRSVAEHLDVSVDEVRAVLSGIHPLTDYLVDITASYYRRRNLERKALWDVATVAWILNSDWVPTELVPSPRLSDDMKWHFDDKRHTIRTAQDVLREPVLGDLWSNLQSLGQRQWQSDGADRQNLKSGV